jgi:hypothetical protein
MSTETIGVARLDREVLRRSVAAKYAEVATNPQLGFHFHTGRPLATRLAYPAAAVDRLPPANVESFAGTGSRYLTSQPRSVTLRGMATPIEVVTIDWGSGAELPLPQLVLAAFGEHPSSRWTAVLATLVTNID